MAALLSDTKVKSSYMQRILRAPITITYPVFTDFSSFYHALPRAIIF